MEVQVGSSRLLFLWQNESEKNGYKLQNGSEFDIELEVEYNEAKKSKVEQSGIKLSKIEQFETKWIHLDQNGAN